MVNNSRKVSMSWLEVIVIAIVEGITEFLPVSSTGHMILAEKILGIESTGFGRMFIVNIQFGAILSVVVLYWRRFFQSVDFYCKLFVAFLPAAVVGFILGDWIDSLLQSALVVAVALLVGGVVLVFVDRIFWRVDDDQEVSYRRALVIGLFQCLAMIPGVSRSAATIVGGTAQRLGRQTAAEFSFFLAVPTMFAASAYKLMKNQDSLSWENLPVLLVGNLVAFVVAMAAIKFFIAYLTRFGFKLFGYYRIVIGAIILILLALGYDLRLV